VSSFIIPTSDPGSPRRQTYPDVVRGSTVSEFILRDRFTYAYSRRNLVSFPNYSTTAAGAVDVYGAVLYPMTIGTGGVWIAAFGERGTLRVQIGASVYTHTFGNPADAWLLNVPSVVTPGTPENVYVRVTKTGGEPYVNLYGLSIYEERLTSAELP
jgi:hypothetical protein